MNSYNDYDRNLAYVASENSKSFAVIDVRHSREPRLIGEIRHPLLAGEGIKYDSVRNLAFVVCRSTATLAVVDVSAPAQPKVVSFLTGYRQPRPHALYRALSL